MNIKLHPYYQHLFHILLSRYLELPEMATLSRQANLEKKLDIKKDLYYKLLGFNQPQQGNDIDNPSSYTIRVRTLNNIAGCLKHCKNWDEMVQHYPLPDTVDFDKIPTIHFRKLSNTDRERIRNEVKIALETKPPVFKSTNYTDLTPQTLSTTTKIPAFTGFFLLLFYVKGDRRFRALPLKISDNCDVEMKRFSDLQLHGKLEKRGSNCFVHLVNPIHLSPNHHHPNPNPFSFSTNTPENTTDPLPFFTIALLTARSNRSVTRNGVGLCKRITEKNYETFELNDSFSELDLNQFPCSITPGDIYHLRKYYIYEYDHSPSEPASKRDLIATHNANFFGYFKRNLDENSIIKLPVSISNGFMVMNHTHEGLEYEGVLTFKPPVLWVRMRTIHNSINFTEEYFAIQFTLNSKSLKGININSTISGLYMATRSKDSAPICGRFILERADFDYHTTKGEILPLNSISNPNVKEQLLNGKGQLLIEG